MEKSANLLKDHVRVHLATSIKAVKVNNKLTINNFYPAPTPIHSTKRLVIERYSYILMFGFVFAILDLT